MKLRVMSFNIQHGFNHKTKAGIDFPAMAEVIRTVNPDIVGLNEVRGLGRTGEYTAQAETLAALLGMHCYFGRSIYVGGTEPYGNAILSKYPIVGTKIIRIPDPVPPVPMEPRTVTRAEVETPEGIVAVYVSHFGLSPAEHEYAVSTVVTALRDEPLPFVLMGDFNMMPDNPLIQVLAERFNGTEPYTDGQFSFPSDKPVMKIDYIFTSRSIGVTGAEIPQICASDHCPIYGDIAVFE